MISPRNTDLNVIQVHDGINMKDDNTHDVTSKKLLLPTDVPSPTCVSSMSSSTTAIVKSPRRMNSNGFAKVDDSTTNANKKQRLESNQFSWFNKPTHQEISKVIFNNAEEPPEKGTACNRRTMSLDLSQEMNLPSLLSMSSSEFDKEDLRELQSSARDRRIRPRRLTPATHQMKQHKGLHHKTTKTIQQCLFDPDELCQVSSSGSTRRMSGHKREVSSLTNETQTSLLMVPSFDSIC